MTAERVSTQHLVVLVNEKRLPLAEVARLTGLTRQAIWKRLKADGVLVKRREKGGAPGVMVETVCAYCGVELSRHKRQLLKADQLRAFCGETCYFAALENPNYAQWRQGCRLARAIVSQRFPLQHQHVVHHKDGDNRNNDRSNLVVFATQAEHIAHHRGRTIAPLWDGAF